MHFAFSLSFRRSSNPAFSKATMRATSFSQRSCNFASKLGRRKSTAPALPQRGAAISTNACSIKPTTTTATSTSTTPPPPPLLASRLVAVALAATFAFAPVSSFPHPAHARLEGVNKPELLPKEFTPVLDVSGFLTDGERAQLRSTTEALEKDTGVKLRILAQNYPETPGLAIKDYWGVDDDTVVFVVGVISCFFFEFFFF